jgi:hypothetical protein
MLGEPIVLGRFRKVRFCETARKPAPMLVPDGLTAKMTVESAGLLSDAIQIKSLEGSLTIEWE